MTEIGIDLLVYFIFLVLGLFSKNGRPFPLMFLISGVYMIFSLGLIAASGTIAISQYYNGVSLQYVTIPVYPFGILSYAMLTIVSFILLYETIKI